MKKLCLLFVVGMFSGAAWADADQWHKFSKEKSPHAEGGCASKGKIAQFHKFHQKEGQQVKVPNKAELKSEKTDKEQTLDQFI